MRNKKEFIGMSKTSLVSQLRSLKDSIVHGPPHYSMNVLTEESKLTWFIKNLRNLGNSHYAYPSYDIPEKNNGIFKIDEPSTQLVKVALLSDWASDTPESHKIAEQVGENAYSVHLGDTYYVGNEKEIAYNFSRENGSWPYGTSGSFAMLGNHEMYSSGKSYFTHLLPFMGKYQPGSIEPVQTQKASYFCLENEHWRIIGLDTGYWSLKGLLGIKPNFALDLHDEQKQWLQDTLKLNDDQRGLIFLSHHQCFSAFEDEFPLPQKTIAGLLEPGRDVLWLWGHEHWFSVYGANIMQNGSKMYARCIGNSGMPVELERNGTARCAKCADPADPANRNLVLYDQRPKETINGNISLGHNGYTTLSLNADQLTISYFDDNGGNGPGRLILEEDWQVDPLTGSLKGIAIRDLTNDMPPENQKLSLYSQQLKDAIL